MYALSRVVIAHVSFKKKKKRKKKKKKKKEEEEKKKNIERDKLVGCRGPHTAAMQSGSSIQLNAGWALGYYYLPCIVAGVDAWSRHLYILTKRSKRLVRLHGTLK